MYLLEWTRGGEGWFAPSYGAVPARIVGVWQELAAGQGGLAAAGELSRLFTAVFLHGGIDHLVLNMVFLWTFGYLTSELLGPWWALAVFALCGVCGNLAQVVWEPSSLAPIIGASGAVCGFEGVYLGLALRWSLPWPDVWPLARPIPPMQLAAFAIVGVAVDMWMMTEGQVGVAHLAHIGGFLSGLAIAALLTSVYPTLAGYRQARLR